MPRSNSGSSRTSPSRKVRLSTILACKFPASPQNFKHSVSQWMMLELSRNSFVLCLHGSIRWQSQSRCFAISKSYQLWNWSDGYARLKIILAMEWSRSPIRLGIFSPRKTTRHIVMYTMEIVRLVRTRVIQMELVIQLRMTQDHFGNGVEQITNQAKHLLTKVDFAQNKARSHGDH